MNNYVSGTLNDADIQAIENAIITIESKLPFLIGLTNEQRQSLLKMGDKSIAFVKKALDYAEQNPDLVPPYTNVQELRKDMKLAEQLNRVIRPLERLTEKVDDTILGAGTDAFSASLTFYNSVRGASEAGIKGSKTIYNDLKERYMITRGKEVDSEPISEN